MKPLVLLAYATKYGSTEETARMVGAVLGTEGFEVEVWPVNKLPLWKPYAAVVLAAALYMGRLHKDARRFVAERREELSRVPVALIVPGPVGKEEKDWASAQRQLDKELARWSWLHPVAQKIVGGKWDPSKSGRLVRWMLRKVPAADARDWLAIRAWARDLAGKLKPPAEESIFLVDANNARHV
jgi:menaquinone-dependent protoporphyrinogen oxidase